MRKFVGKKGVSNETYRNLYRSAPASCLVELAILAAVPICMTNIVWHRSFDPPTQNTIKRHKIIFEARGVAH
jgi:hypothetical protein